MTAAYAMALFGVFSALSAILAVAWAASRGQMRSSESAKYYVLDADEAENEISPSAVSRPRRARWLAAALALVFLGILSSTILTVIIAARAGTPQAAAKSPPASQSAKCPF